MARALPADLEIPSTRLVGSRLFAGDDLQLKLAADWDRRFTDALIEAISTGRKLTHLYVRRQVEARLQCLEGITLGEPEPMTIAQLWGGGWTASSVVPFEGAAWLFDARIVKCTPGRPLHAHVSEHHLVLAVEGEHDMERMIMPLLASEIEAIRDHIARQRSVIAAYNEFVSDQARDMITTYWPALLQMQEHAVQRAVDQARREIDAMKAVFHALDPKGTSLLLP
jgi:hypothetical protein